MQLFTFLLTAILSFAQQPDMAPLANGYAGPNDQKTIEISVISEERANQFFKMIAGDEMIPFKSPYACASNATAVAQEAEEMSIITGRVRAVGKLTPDTYQNPDYPHANWMMHTAAVVYVSKPGGQKQLYVLDPALAGKPLPVEEWKAKLLGPGGDHAGRIDHFYFGSRFQLGMSFDEHRVTEGESEGEPSRSDWDEDAVAVAQSERAAYRRDLGMAEMMRTPAPSPAPAPAPATAGTAKGAQ